MLRGEGRYRVSPKSREPNAGLTAGPHSRKVRILRSARLHGDNSTLTRKMLNALRDQVNPDIAEISTVIIVIASLRVVLSPVLGR
jgi:hypothetical protein